MTDDPIALADEPWFTDRLQQLETSGDVVDLILTGALLIWNRRPAFASVPIEKSERHAIRPPRRNARGGFAGRLFVAKQDCSIILDRCTGSIDNYEPREIKSRTNLDLRWHAPRLGACIKSRADALANLPSRARWFPKGDAAIRQRNGSRECQPSSGDRWRDFYV